MIEAIVILSKIILGLIGVVILLAYAVGFLIILTISLVYFCGYIYDSIFGKLLIKLGYYALKNIPKLIRVNNKNIINNIWRILKPKDIYLRYETPLCTYCFSYSAIIVLCGIMPHKYSIDIQYVLASLIYLISYFVGMSRKCGDNSEYYEKILKNNLDFLKLSFLPISFLITIAGFLFTATGFKVQDCQLSMNYFKNIITEIVKYNNNQDVLLMTLKLVLLGIIILVLLYIISLPIQLISYFVILAIKYFKEHGNSYRILLRKYTNIVIYLIKNI